MKKIMVFVELLSLLNGIIRNESNLVLNQINFLSAEIAQFSSQNWGSLLAVLIAHKI